MHLSLHKVCAGLILTLGMMLMACSQRPQSVQAVKVGHVNPADTIRPSAKVAKLMAPYRFKVDSVMGIPLCTAAIDLPKQAGENLLGNMATDLLMKAAKSQGQTCDLALLASGGLRVPLAKGPITVGTVFELMPFENEVVALKVKGEHLLELANLQRKYKNLNFSGAKLIIGPGSAMSMLVNGQAIEPQKEYWLATIDYLADGGDNCAILAKATERKVLNQKLREAFIAQMKELNARGQQLTATLEGRITVQP